MNELNEQINTLDVLITKAKEDIENIRSYALQIFALNNNKVINEEKFILELTDKEKNAFYFIKNIIDTEGNISISQLVNDSNISRPVFTSLLQKMSNSGFAIVTNQGVKGTYIKIIN